MRRFLRFAIVAAVAFLAAGIMGGSASAAPKTMTYKAPEGTVKIEFCTPEMFRVRRSRDNSFEANEPWMVVKYNWNNVQVKETQADGKIVLTTSALRIELDKDSNYAVEVFDLMGRQVARESGHGESQVTLRVPANGLYVVRTEGISHKVMVR